MLSPQAAWSLLAPFAQPLGSESVCRSASVGRVVAKRLLARVDVPSHDVSAMDGFAVSGALTADEPLAISATVAAGTPPGAQLARGTAVAIMTGAPVPRGADRIIPVENAERRGEEVTVRQPGVSGQHIRRRGEVQRTGDTLLEPGRTVTPGGLSLLASHGVSELSVFARPRIRLVVTGDEVVPPESTPKPGQLRDAHTDFLQAAVAALGLELESLGIVRDDREALRTAIEQGLKADVLLLTGGVSMGEFDFVGKILEEFHCETLFDRVAVQPGKPLVAAHHAGGMAFGLPGNPASVMASFWLFVRPFLRCLLGEKDGFWHGALAATLAAPLPAAKGRDRFFACEVAFEEGRLLAHPQLPKGSHDVLAYAAGTALVRVRADMPASRPGDACEVLPLADWRGSP